MAFDAAHSACDAAHPAWAGGLPAVVAVPGTPTPGDGAIVALAREILQRPEYARHRTSLNDAWLADLVDTISAWVSELPQLRDTAPAMYWSLLCGLLVVASLLIGHVVWTIHRALVVQAGPLEAARIGAGRDFAAEAQALARSGAFLEASHRLLLASLAHAAKHHVLELLPADSNDAVCRKLRSSPLSRPLRADLVALIGRTDAAWFGARPEDPDLFEAWHRAYEQLRRSVP